MRRLGYLGRFMVMWMVIWWFAWLYAFGRIGCLFVRGGKDARRQAVAHLRGRTMRRLFAALGACFVKLGQVLSSRPDLLDPAVIDELRQLQDRMPPFAYDRAKQTIESQLGGTIASHFAELDEIPVAAASVAQVHRGKLLDGTEVAVKVLRPDVRAKVERDSAILLGMAKIAAWHPKWKISDPVGHLTHFTAGILEQTDLRLEVANCARFHTNFASVEAVRFPTPYPDLSGERVMTMSFIRGKKIDALPPGDHRALAKRLQQVVLKMCFTDGFFHADLHPGNVMVGDDGDLCILDLGLVTLITEDILVQFIDFTKCLSMGTAKDFVAHIRKFHTYVVDVDWAALEVDVTAFVGHFRGQNVAELEMGALVNEVFAIGRRYKVHMLPELALVFVGLVTAEGIGKQLNPHNNLFADTAAYLMPLLVERGLGLQG